MSGPLALSAASADEPRAPPAVIPAGSIKSGSGSGDGWRIDLPPGVIADDLKEPGLFAGIVKSQGGRLRQLDRVILISNDRRWAVDAVIAHVTPPAAPRPGLTLTGFRLLNLEPRI